MAQQLTPIAAALAKIAKDKGLASLVTVEYVETLLTSLLPTERAAMEKMHGIGLHEHDDYSENQSKETFDTHFTQTVK